MEAATKLIGAENRHILYYGIPSGFEFLSLAGRRSAWDIISANAVPR
jgi:hypothetical protein